MSDALPPVNGPHDKDMDMREWFSLTLKRIADDADEARDWERLVGVLRRDFKCRDVGAVMELSRTQLEVAATTAVGPTASKGTVRLVLKYLGTSGQPHEPPSMPTESDSMQSAFAAREKTILFGRLGKTGVNSSESNFPESMFPSSTAVISHSELVLPKTLKVFIKSKASQFNDTHPKMPQAVTLEIVEEVCDWVITTYGTCPVRFSAWHV